MFELQNYLNTHIEGPKTVKKIFVSYTLLMQIGKIIVLFFAASSERKIMSLLLHGQKALTQK